MTVKSASEKSFPVNVRDEILHAKRSSSFISSLYLLDIIFREENVAGIYITSERRFIYTRS